jgi:serine/threonine-protein kinase HipA
MPRILDLWFNQNKAGRLTQDDSGRLLFAYDAGFLQSSHAWPLSVSLPLREQEFDDRVTRPFFSGDGSSAALGFPPRATRILLAA